MAALNLATAGEARPATLFTGVQAPDAPAEPAPDDHQALR